MSPSPPSDEAVAAQLERMLRSAEFERSARLQKFLRYVVAESRAGRSEGLKEYAIGVEVFSRGPTFDPRLDPIVRVEARRLRGKLKDYYAAGGSSDPVRIEMPVGGYEVVLRTPPAAAPSGAPPFPPTVVPRVTTGVPTGPVESAWWRPPPRTDSGQDRYPARSSARHTHPVRAWFSALVRRLRLKPPGS